jgi:holo-[acyl-carrier-protein] synthase
MVSQEKIKEAVIRSATALSLRPSLGLGTGISKNFGWKDIEILNDSLGKPYIHHINESEYSKYRYEVSISHTKDYGCAVVVCEEK